jgi:hypothetical protein
MKNFISQVPKRQWLVPGDKSLNAGRFPMLDFEDFEGWKMDFEEMALSFYLATGYRNAC